MTDARIVRNRARIRDALLMLLDRRPFEQITARDIAAAAGVGPTTFYRHHSGKEALLEELAIEEIAALFDCALPIYDADDTAGAFLSLCRHVEERRALWSVLLNGGASQMVRGELLRRARVATSERAVRGWLPPELGASLAVSSTIEVFSWWLRQPDPLSAEAVAKMLERIVVGSAPG